MALEGDATTFPPPSRHLLPTFSSPSAQLHPGDVNLLLGVAHVYDALNDTDKAMQVRHA